MRTLLLDADILAYKHASAAQTTTQFPGCEPHVELDDWEQVRPRVDGDIDALVNRLRADKVIVCLSCPTPQGWRRSVLPSYKANRNGVVKPVYLEKVKDYLEKAYASYRKPTLEADDIMGILSTHPRLVKGEKVIVSDDKDMGTIPGLWARPGWVGGREPDPFPKLVSSEEADEWHLMQTICGDTVDGYAGCPGAGPDRAAAVLDGGYWHRTEHCLRSGPRKGQTEVRWHLADAEDMPVWKRVVTLYEKHGLTEQDALVQARVARICRHTDYDFKRKEVILWNP